MTEYVGTNYFIQSLNIPLESIGADIEYFVVDGSIDDEIQRVLTQKWEGLYK